MANLFDNLVELLKTDKRFFSEQGALLRNKLYETAMNMDSQLLHLLLSNEAIKAHFFTDIDGVLVFDKIKFGWVINNREFLPDSFTRYKNKIGLVDRNDNFISGSNDVVLSFPYKDCVLEGGQTREEQKKDEIFYNETLAPDEVDRLLYPKVFTNAVRYTADGQEKATSFTENDNLIIKGNNLLAISSLLKKYEGKIKLIYIDPPFNTGNDSFNYNDRFSRSTWLSFMKDRLKVAKRLLSQDGNIFIHIDINQSHYLKVLADEIFDKENFVEEIIWAYGSPSGGRAATPKPVNIHDYILHYSKSYAHRKQNRVYVPYSEKYIKDWFKYSDEDGRLYRRRQRGKDENGNAIWSKQYLDESKGVPLSTVWSDIQQVYADPRAYKEGNKADVEVIKTFSGGQKPEALIKRIIEMASDECDIVLDFHLGTGTTAAVAHKTGRKYIGVEQINTQIEMILNRLQKVISGDTAGISKSVNWQGGGSFVFCELAKLNQNYVEQIQEAQNDEELSAVWDNILQSGFISSYVNPKEINPEAEDFNELSFEEKKQLFIELLDKNMLYVNLCDIDDEDYQISEDDKAFTKSFYGVE
ncbi:MAG: site-specific DNA-methyltransferase [Clostridiales bacterium]|nr:site-specific DNA-methyltransferase [Clostridiales bacterium]